MQRHTLELGPLHHERAGIYLFLNSPWRRLVLVAFVIPLGILRNGFRIL